MKADIISSTKPKPKRANIRESKHTKKQKLVKYFF